MTRKAKKIVSKECIGTFEFELVREENPLPEGARLYSFEEHQIKKEECIPVEGDEQFSLLVATLCCDYLYYIDGKFLALRNAKGSVDGENVLPVHVQVSSRDGKPLPKDPASFTKDIKVIYYVALAAYTEGVKMGLEQGMKLGLEKAKSILKNRAEKAGKALGVSPESNESNEQDEPKESLNPKFH